MQHLLSDIFSENADLLLNLSTQQLALYTTVLDREEALRCLSRVSELRIIGASAPDRMRILADDRRTSLLVLQPPASEISIFLAGVGSRLRVLKLFLTSVVQLELPVLRGLTDLELSDNRRLETLSAPEELPILERLSLSNTAVSTLEDFPLPATLTELFLDNTRLVAIPDEIRELEALEQLDLCDLQLRYIPEWFPDFHLIGSPNSVLLHNTHVRGTPIPEGDLSGTELRAALRSLSRPSIPEYKVVLLGDAEAGKTLVLHRLLNDDNTPFEDVENDIHTDGCTYIPEGFDHNSTPGILIKQKEFDLDLYGLGDEMIRVHFWDFGGQDILHSAHRAFLTDRTLYVILLNTRNNTQDARARYWLRYLQDQQSVCPVLLVLNKIDQNPNASIDISGLRRKFGEGIKALTLSSLKYNRLRFSKAFTTELLTTLISSRNLTFNIPTEYNKVRAWLRRLKEPYVELQHFREKCAACDQKHSSRTGAQLDPQEAHKIQDGLLRDFTDLGLCIYLPKATETNRHIIPRPRWITNAIYTILINKHSEVADGLISEFDIQALLNPDGPPSKPIYQVYPDEKYDAASFTYIKSVMNEFGHSFPVPYTKLLFIPMLCTHGIPDLGKDYFNDSLVLRFRYILDDLPSSTLFKLLMKLFEGAQQRRIWLTGGEFAWDTNNCSALVIAEDHCIDIYMHPDGTQEAAMKQLTSLQDTIDSVLNGHILTRQIGLRVATKTEFFDYDLLYNSKDYIRIVYSRVKDGQVYVEDILNYRDNSNERLRIRLREDIVAICRQMQENENFYNCSEDTRTLYLSNSLFNRGYSTTMNHLSGYGKGLRRSGEIDLRIDSRKNATMSICEALILRSRGQKDYWFQHLDKLVGRYNQIGYPYVFLISYVEDPNQNFDGIYEKYCEHIRNCPPSGYVLREIPVCDPVNDPSAPSHIKIVESRYHATHDILVYHIFVRFWNPTKKRTMRRPHPGACLKPKITKKTQRKISCRNPEQTELYS